MAVLVSMAQGEQVADCLLDGCWSSLSSRQLHSVRRLQRADASSWKQHSFLFMGGLQRGGTAWLETLVTSSRMVSSLSFDNVDPNTYWQRRPWKLQNHTQRYWRGVVRSGGIRGKFIRACTLTPTWCVMLVSTGSRSRAFSTCAQPHRRLQRSFTRSGHYSGTLRSLYSGKDTRESCDGAVSAEQLWCLGNSLIAFVMRHPLVWALAIEKWIFHDFTALRTVEERVDFWFGVMSRATEQLPQLRDVIVLQLETAGASPDLQLGVSRHLLCSAGNTPDAARAINQLDAACNRQWKQSRNPCQQHGLRELLAEWYGVQIIRSSLHAAEAFSESPDVDSRPNNSPRRTDSASGSWRDVESPRLIDSATRSKLFRGWPSFKQMHCCGQGFCAWRQALPLQQNWELYRILV